MTRPIYFNMVVGFLGVRSQGSRIGYRLYARRHLLARITLPGHLSRITDLGGGGVYATRNEGDIVGGDLRGV